MGSALQVAETPRRAADHLVTHLESLGIDRVYGIPGGAISPVFDALIDSRIRVVVCQHEAMAAYQACGYARATGRPGVLLCTAGPGILNAIPGIAAAFHDEVPLLVLAGDVRTDFAGRGVIQDGGPAGLDIEAMLTPITRFRDRLSQPERVVSLLHAATDASLQHPRGPALLQLPVDRCGAPVPSLPTWRPSASDHTWDEEGVAHAAALVEGARRPALLLGLGAARAGVGDLAARLAARLRMPVLLELDARGLVPESSPLVLGGVGVGASPAADRYLADGVDVLVTVGARLDDTTTRGYGDLLRPSEALVQLDHDPMRLGRAWPATVALSGPLDETLAALTGRSAPPAVPMLLARDEAIRRARPPVQEVLPSLGVAPFDPRSVVAMLQETFGPDTVFASDIGNHLLFAARHLRHERPGQFHVGQGTGAMGSGIGCAMGLADALRGRERVVGICGDGSMLMAGNDLATCAKYEIPVVLAVFDNGELGMVRHGRERLYGRDPGSRTPPVDLVQYARSLGATAYSIRSLDDLQRAASAEVAGPVVLHLPIDPEVRGVNPREPGFKKEVPGG